MKVMQYITTKYGVEGKDVHIFKDVESLGMYAVKYDYAQMLYQGWIYPVTPEWIDYMRTTKINEEK